MKDIHFYQLRSYIKQGDDLMEDILFRWILTIGFPIVVTVYILEWNTQNIIKWNGQVIRKWNGLE